MEKYPECHKLSQVSEKSQQLGEFLEWLGSKYTLCTFVEGYREEYVDDEGERGYDYVPEGYYPARPRIEELLAEYFGIDLVKVDQERNQILKELQDANNNS